MTPFRKHTPGDACCDQSNCEAFPDVAGVTVNLTMSDGGTQSFNVPRPESNPCTWHAQLIVDYEEDSIECCGTSYWKEKEYAVFGDYGNLGSNGCSALVPESYILCGDAAGWYNWRNQYQEFVWGYSYRWKIKRIVSVYVDLSAKTVEVWSSRVRKDSTKRVNLFRTGEIGAIPPGQSGMDGAWGYRYNIAEHKREGRELIAGPHSTTVDLNNAFHTLLRIQMNGLPSPGVWYREFEAGIGTSSVDSIDRIPSPPNRLPGNCTSPDQPCFDFAQSFTEVAWPPDESYPFADLEIPTTSIDEEPVCPDAPEILEANMNLPPNARFGVKQLRRPFDEDQVFGDLITIQDTMAAFSQDKSEEFIPFNCGAWHQSGNTSYGKPNTVPEECEVCELDWIINAVNPYADSFTATLY